jgi:histidine triad (HIT) family protein
MLVGMDCLFCKIADGAIPAKKVFEDEHAFAIQDIKPQAPVHVLVIPKKHVRSLAAADDKALLGHLLDAARRVAEEQKLGNGYRVVINTGPNGGLRVRTTRPAKNARPTNCASRG